MLLAHENSRRNQELDYQRESLRQRLFFLPEQYYPNTLMTDEWSKTFGNEKIVVKYFGPAHTDGDIAVHFQNANVVHLGDLLYDHIPPLIDVRNGASFLSWIAALEKIRMHYDRAQEGASVSLPHVHVRRIETSCR